MTAPQDILDRLGNRCRVLVVGDLILDRYVHGEVPRISPEAPVPVLHVRGEELRAGGAANVAANLARLGAKTQLVGVVGRDEAGESLKVAIAEAGVPATGIRVDPSRPTVEKTRLLARHQQMLRFDREEVRPLDAALEKKVAELVAKLAEKVDAVVLSDYGKGLLTDAVIAAACRARCEVLVDPKGRDYGRYRGASLITPNALEAQVATGIDTATLEGCREAATALRAIGGFRHVLITRGPQGIYFQEEDGSEGDVPTRARSVFDVTGAGDTVIATLALGLGSGLELPWAVTLANAAAGLVVERLGACSLSRDELSAALRGSSSTVAKVADLSSAAVTVLSQRSLGRRIAFTNGCFDLLHAGHVESLEFARSQADYLVVAVNSDESVTRQKGEGRPIQPLAVRARTLAGLACVDLVLPFEEDTPEKVIRRITPDVLVKGEDWAERGVVGRSWVEEHGGRVVIAPLFGGLSTTALIRRIRGEEDAPRRSRASGAAGSRPRGTRTGRDGA